MMSNIILNETTGLLTNNPKFEKYKIHDDLFMIREQSKKGVIGYVNKHPNNHWFWFMGATISNEFINFDDAAEDLAQSFLTVKMNTIAKKLGTFNNEKLTMLG